MEQQERQAQSLKESPGFIRFDKVFAEELIKIPEPFKKGIAQFVVEQKAKRYSIALPMLYTLGEYCPRGDFNRPMVVLYYGSFKKIYSKKSEENMRDEIAKTLAHEILHHWELTSGYDDLGEEDRRKLMIWKKKFEKEKKSRYFKLLEAAIFLYVLLLLIALIARWYGPGLLHLF